MDNWQFQLNQDRFNKKTDQQHARWSMLAPSVFTVYEDWQRTLNQLPTIKQSGDATSIKRYYEEIIRLTLLLYYTRMRAIELNKAVMAEAKAVQLDVLGKECGRTVDQITHALEYV